jgi:hypothetical protein
LSLGDVLQRPLLARYPDGRRSPLPLVEPVLLPYLALLFGSAVAGVVGAYNALAIRRFGLAALSLAAGAVGWFAFALLVVRVDDAHGNVELAVIAGRFLHFIIGGLLFLKQRPYARGHAFLQGTMLPVVMTYIAALVITLAMPSKILALLVGVPPGR